MTLRNLMTSLLALTLMVCVGGCDSDTDETSNLAASDWSECYTAGFCSEAARLGYFPEDEGNIYAGQTMESSGCGDTESLQQWERGEVDFAFPPPGYMDMCR